MAVTITETGSLPGKGVFKAFLKLFFEGSPIFRAAFRAPFGGARLLGLEGRMLRCGHPGLLPQRVFQQYRPDPVGQQAPQSRP
jgi:hypothetical protein